MAVGFLEIANPGGLQFLKREHASSCRHPKRSLCLHRLRTTNSASSGNSTVAKHPDEEGKKLRISPRDFVVHADYGVGKFLGTTMENEEKFAVVQYMDGLLNIPIREAKGALSLFKPADVEKKPQLNKMDNRASWQRTVSNARKSARAMALNLVRLYSARNKTERQPCERKDGELKEFEDSWGFTATEDQKKSIAEVVNDMCDSNKPMDRLICGDVGFGKTEVAIRAAFLAFLNGRQVVILAPTTVLVSQHAKNFQQRLSQYGVSVGVHMRFVTDEQKRQCIEGAKSGQVDIVIGTHGVLRFGKEFQNLGLVIIDEEQRFGVEQKETFKAFRTSVDVLTLSATPIPRTMYMGLSGVRDMTLMRTPPPMRKPVETVVVTKDDPIVEENIRRELERQGQIFIVTPRIKDIQSLSDWLEEAFPEARVIVAHSKVKDLELRMFEFAQGNADIMLSTNIIESGIDIPRVNTLIVNRSDMFGMAQLYQLRGRVGRSKEQAYAVLMYTSSDKIGGDALRRLFAMEEYSDLGSSFELAKRDLEVRGAGALYGFEQSGTVAGVGVELYMGYLKDSVTEWKIVERFVYSEDPKIRLSKNSPGISEKYIPDRGTRMKVMKEILSCTTLQELDKRKTEVTVEYGKLLASAETFFAWMELYLICRDLGVDEVRNIDGKHISMTSKMPQICWEKIIRDAFDTSNKYALKSDAAELR